MGQAATDNGSGGPSASKMGHRPKTTATSVSDTAHNRSTYDDDRVSSALPRSIGTRGHGASSSSASS
eukprot:4148661-Pyramimonas_sp.AAC.1